MSALSAEFLAGLRCPETRQPLTLATPDVLEKLRAASARNRSGEVPAAFENALVRADGTLGFPIRDGIPVLLISEAIPVA